MTPLPTIKFSPPAAKDYKKLQKALVPRVLNAIEKIAAEPLRAGIPLKGVLKGKYKFRVGDYRILYLVLPSQRTVVLINIGHRRDIYKNG